jgi:hypothetical protein
MQNISPSDVWTAVAELQIAAEVLSELQKACKGSHRGSVSNNAGGMQTAAGASSASRRPALTSITCNNKEVKCQHMSLSDVQMAGARLPERPHRCVIQMLSGGMQTGGTQKAHVQHACHQYHVWQLQAPAQPTADPH